MSQKKSIREGTTVGLLYSTKNELDKLKNRWKCGSYDAVIQRLLSGQYDVYVEFTSIDNDLPQLHTVVFQLGEDAKSLYYWDGQSTTSITLEKANKMLKQPKPNITFTIEEAEKLGDVSSHGGQLNETWKRLLEFVENAGKIQ